ncbi:MAG TPA: hypothetical protein VLE91_01075 [Candidatus Saccharimonadales bacterium]|nr:hypothetical protein [Candidatus Saccharimonadales bacterium]
MPQENFNVQDRIGSDYTLSRSSRSWIHLPPEELTSAVHSYAAGDVIDFRSPTFVSDLLTEMSKKNSHLRRIFYTLMRVGGTVQEPWDILKEEIEKPQIDTEFLGSAQLAPWLTTMSLTYGVYGNAMRIPDDMKVKDFLPVPEDVKETVDMKLRQLTEVIKNLQSSDTPTFARFSSVNSLVRATVSTKMSGNGQGKVDTLTQSYPEIKRDSEATDDVLVAENYDAWERIKYGWDWSTINDTIATLPDIQAKNVFNHLCAAIELNSVHFEKQTDTGVELADPDALAFMAGYVWRNYFFVNEAFNKRHPELKELLETNVEAPGLSVPRKELPSPVLAYLEKAAELVKPEELEKYLESVSQRIKEPHSKVSFMSVLIFLANKVPALRGAYEAHVSKMNIGEDIKEVLLDRQPGRVWQTTSGALRLTRGTRTLDLFPTYTSKVPEPEAQKQEEPTPVITKVEPSTPQNQKEATAVFPYDFVGDVATLPDQDISSYLRGVNSQKFLFDSDKALAEISAIQKNLEEDTSGKTYIWTAALNQGDASQREARKLGFETIVISGNSVTFILSSDILYTEQGDKKTPIAITGTLDGDRLLAFDADPGLTFEDIGIAASRIVLELMKSKKQSELTANMKKLAKPQIDLWNQGKRGNMSRISPNPKPDSEVFVAIKVNGQTLFASAE